MRCKIDANQDEFCDIFMPVECQTSELAEGVGFEPTVGYPTLDFESSALNRTQPPFRFRKIDILPIDSEKSAFIMRRGRPFANPLGARESSQSRDVLD
jgi:hypothetical protein